MLPTLDTARAVSISRGAKAPRGQVSSHQTDDTGPRSQCHISKLPDDALSHIFNHLGCDDIAQVNDTCCQFRRVVHERHPEALLFSQLPVMLRKQHLMSSSLQKQLVQDGLNPFITKPSGRACSVFNAEQQVVVSCFHPLRRMMSVSRYCLTDVLAENICRNGAEFFYTPGSSTILLHYKRYCGVFLLGQNRSGWWSSQSLDRVVCGTNNSPRAGVSCSSNKRYLSVFAFDKKIQVYKFDSGSWQLNKKQRIAHGYRFEVSPSGKYLAVLTINGSIKSIRCFDQTAHWKCMPMPSGNRDDLDLIVQWRRFSTSEQHLAIKYRKKLVILSVNCQGRWKVSWETTWSRCTNHVCLQFSPSEQHAAISYTNKVVILSLDSRGRWNVSWESPTDRSIDYVKFCPSGSWLLIAFLRSVDIIGLDPAGKCISQQSISSRNLQLTFSPGGHYLCSQQGEEQYLLWRLIKSGRWAFYGDLTDQARFGGAELVQSCITFSSCDNYLLTSTMGGAVNFWGRDGQRSWMLLGSGQHDCSVYTVRFSQSGTHALTVDAYSIYIWGRDDGGLWTVKGAIKAPHISNAHFHPMAEHLIVFWSFHCIRIVELRPVPESEGR